MTIEAWTGPIVSKLIMFDMNNISIKNVIYEKDIFEQKVTMILELQLYKVDK